VRAPLLQLVLALACVGSACQSSNAGFLTSSSNSSDEEALLIITTSTLGALTTIGGVLTTVVALEAEPSSAVQNRRQIEIDLTRGYGDWMNDLAAELGLPAGLVPHLGLALKNHRATLSDALAVTPVRIDVWQRTLADALCCDPWIYPFARNRFGCRPEGERLVSCQD